jgi:hypothetical protein
MTALVIPSEHEKSFGEVDLVGIEKKETFDREETTIHIITKEEILYVFWITTNLKELQQIVKLTVDITTNWEKRQ